MVSTAASMGAASPKSTRSTTRFIASFARGKVSSRGVSSCAPRAQDERPERFDVFEINAVQLHAERQLSGCRLSESRSDPVRASRDSDEMPKAVVMAEILAAIR